MAAKGLDCRATAPYVTDPAGCAPCVGDTYAHDFGNGISAGGWNGGTPPLLRDRDAGIDPRLSGTNGRDGPTSDTLELDVSAGDKDIWLALGDAGFESKLTCKIYDDSTLRATVCTDQYVNAGSFLDAQGTEYSAANWPSSNVKRTVNIGSGKLKIEITGEAGISRGVIAHVAVDNAAAGTWGGALSDRWNRLVAA